MTDPQTQFQASQARWASICGWILSLEMFHDAAERVLPPELFKKVQDEATRASGLQSRPPSK